MGEGAGEVVVGTRKSFVFYLGDCTKIALKTDWLMYEYALIGNPMASFVLCGVFIKFHYQNYLSEHVFSSYGEETVAAVRHVGIQCDETAVSVTESKMHDENTVDLENDSQALTEPVAEQAGNFGSLVDSALGVDVAA